MRPSSRSPRTLLPRALAALCAAAMVALLLATPSSSAPGDPPGSDDIPPRDIAGGYGVVSNSQGAVARRAKMYITLRPEDPIFALLYLYLDNWPLDNPTSYQSACLGGRPCVADPFRQPACATSDPATQRLGSYAKHLMYPVAQLPGGGVDVGAIATVKVRMVAFGSIPATATLELRSPRSAGKVEPFVIHLWQVLGSRRGCDPTWRPGDATTIAEGRVEIRIADLSVDGVPVDVGPSCRTRQPADLRLWGEPTGYSPGGGGDLGAYDGLRTGSLGPLESPFYGADNGRVIPDSTGMTIPPFAGCGVGGEDLSPLVTAMASGPNNPVRIKQSPLITRRDGSVDLNNVRACDEARPKVCPVPGPATPERPPLPDGDE